MHCMNTTRSRKCTLTIVSDAETTSLVSISNSMASPKTPCFCWRHLRIASFHVFTSACSVPVLSYWC
ncbi:hypothetical protein PICMEDRAFT_17577 [Pichia membranifaciens NRRL Y-2026]|uniref:Uncharacterized protein n=1 Tax=Pichia membranifaciens NRRL Y-2026 TaxID=763406 RepID=A0A1E3NG14_9ASCO|nr:hypothetical protein PICMEDRAFT_17577 [Pichia membranifaciens NRRL Y-2026]ODQ45080.1 hypothetical protein PICMEDRAFT_17577 [Pichia membranifaciens NRRL Y-2026]